MSCRVMAPPRRALRPTWCTDIQSGSEEWIRRHPTKDNPYAVGDSVWVKSRGTRCDARYFGGTVTGTVSSQAAEVDDVPCHVRDIRRRDVSVKSMSSDSLGSSQEDPMILRFRAQPQPEAPTESSGEALEGRPTARRSARIRRRRACLL
ncbi:LOW QUALITY PROTEIN: hypothetical protein M514_09382 [Trichuris suis]|uniref:Uncharacterized protein n=1 Tax=Trichuris suis TaxID=68888 RepID=A0A085MXT2_9BILA|nr:LOW QUALITY PROTEIN: hypothetical protein M513_09382 [Trichuris suis]KFD62028.1 LOW QUALITY PROTEIN: hypothetical protein M514_09382 [Trichuris suis]